MLDEILATVESIGVERTIQAIQDAKSNILQMQDLNIAFIIDSVSKVTSVTKDRILNSGDRNDDKKMAVAICVYFIKTELRYPLSIIKQIFHKDESQLYRYNNIVENRPEKPKTDLDRKLEKYFKEVNILLIEKKIKDGK